MTKKETPTFEELLRQAGTEISKAPPPITPLDLNLGPDMTIHHEISTPRWERIASGDRYRLWELTCLATDIDPSILHIGGEPLWWTGQLEGLPDRFFELWEIVNRDELFARLPPQEYSGRMLYQCSVGLFARWAGSRGVSIPEKMRELASVHTNSPSKQKAEPTGQTTPEVEPPFAPNTPTKQRNFSWHDHARAEADKLHLRDMKNGAYDSLTNLSQRVATALKEAGVMGPRGPLSASTIMREALQSDRWKRPKLETGNPGNSGDGGLSQN